MKRHAFRLIVLAMLILLGVGAGCGHEVHEEGSVATITFGPSTYVGLIVIPIAVAIIAATVFALTSDPTRRRKAAIVLVIDVLAVILAVPGVWRDRVTLDAQGLTQRTGFWWSQTVKGFRTDDVREIRIVRKPAGRKNRMQVIWEIHEKNGTTHDIDPGDPWENATPYLVPELRERGISVNDHR